MVLTSAVNLEVMDLSGEQVISMKNVFTSHKLPVPTNAIPDADDISRWPHLHNLRLPKLHNCTVELLIGQDVPEALVPREIVSGSPGAPYAVKSSLGWTLNGPVGSAGVGSQSVISSFIQNDINLSRQVERMFQLNNVGAANSENQAASLEDKMAINIWNGSVKYSGTHYEVSIPFREYPVKLPDSKHLATQRLERLRSKLARQPDIHRKYSKYMDELLEKGYAEKAEDRGRIGATWCLPHHAVFNGNKPDKIRVVFDCSAKQDNISLNTATPD